MPPPIDEDDFAFDYNLSATKYECIISFPPCLQTWWIESPEKMDIYLYNQGLTDVSHTNNQLESKREVNRGQDIISFQHGQAKVSDGIPSVTKKAKVQYECCVCHRNFPIGQALGGHKRFHSRFLASSSIFEHPMDLKTELWDLNMPPPIDEDDSVLAIPQGSHWPPNATKTSFINIKKALLEIMKKMRSLVRSMRKGRQSYEKLKMGPTELEERQHQIGQKMIEKVMKHADERAVYATLQSH
eukprot:Gb_34772 [translate_table: standard]